MAMTTSKTGYRAGYQPLPSGVFVAPFPHAFREGGSEAEPSSARSPAFDLLLASQTAPGETAAMVIEPVLGEGGYIPAPAAFLQGLRARCDEHGILFVADEVQSGFGRTGTMFAIERVGRAARRRRDGQGHRVRVPDLGDRRVGRAHGPLADRARTAAPTAATRSAARPRWRRSTCSPTPGFMDNGQRARRAAARRAARIVATQHPVIGRRARSGAHGRAAS